MTDGKAASSAPRKRRTALKAQPATAADPTTPDAIEIAMDLAATGQAPSAAARAILERQAQLIGWQIASERASFALKVLTGLAGVAVAVAIGLILWAASQYRGVTVQPFSTPPDLQARGLTGAAIAARLLDKLSDLQMRTTSVRTASSYDNSWSDALQVEIPQTGVSAGEAWRFLRARLGKETQISGEVIRTNTGLRISVRSDGQPAPLVSGDEADLEALLDQVAAAVYAKNQPYRYSIFLIQSGRRAEGNVILEQLTRSTLAAERRWAFSGLSASLRAVGRFEESYEKALASQRVDDRFAPAFFNASRTAAALGWMERSYQANELGVRHLSNARDLDIAAAKARQGSSKGEGLALLHDYSTALPLFRERMATIGLDALSSANASASLIGMRETTAAIALARPRSLVYEGVDYAHELPALSHIALEDWPAAVAALGPLRAALETSPSFAEQRRWPRRMAPSAAYALARAGQLNEAKALVADLPLDSYWVVIARGQVAALAGDVQGSERWFATAAQQAPSLADAELAWGRARLDRGDLAGAIDRFKAARKKAPRWADPLKLWGDALMAEGDGAGAIRKYKAAEPFALCWGGLHLAWGKALLAEGKSSEAADRLRLAQGLDLSAADRVLLDRLMTSAQR